MQRFYFNFLGSRKGNAVLEYKTLYKTLEYKAWLCAKYKAKLYIPIMVVH